MEEGGREIRPRHHRSRVKRLFFYGARREREREKGGGENGGSELARKARGVHTDSILFLLDRLRVTEHSPSLDIPAAMHFLSLQYWQRFLLILRMLHCWFLVQGRYWIFCWIERRKKPWNGKEKRMLKQVFAVSVYLR